MVTQRELDDLTNEMMELTGEMRELKGMLLRRLSEAMVAVKTEQRAQERIEERVTAQDQLLNAWNDRMTEWIGVNQNLKHRIAALELQDKTVPPGSQPTYFGENIENLKTRVTELETYHSPPKIQDLESLPSPDSSTPSEPTSSPQ